MQRSTLGCCPECEEPIPARRLLIEYETDEGPDAFAECPDCGDVVHPV